MSTLHQQIGDWLGGHAVRSDGDLVSLVELRVLRLLSSGESVYGSRERALAWLRCRNPRLRGRAPLELMKTDVGSRIVEELLVQIDEGMFV